MYIAEELINFFQFILIGIIISLIFDFFRAYRKYKKLSAFIVGVQDVIYFVISTIIIMIGIINILDSNIRVYMFIAIIIGCGLHFSLLSKFVIKVYSLIFNTSHKIFEFFLLPFKCTGAIFVTIYNFLKKIAKKCCIFISNMVTLICKSFKGKFKSFSLCLKFKKNKPKDKKSKKQKRVKNEKRLWFKKRSKKSKEKS